MLVDHRLGDVGALGDLLDRGALVTALGEQRSCHVDQLMTPLSAGHAGAGCTHFLIGRCHALQATSFD
jgi:hypothetical protein